MPAPIGWACYRAVGGKHGGRRAGAGWGMAGRTLRCARPAFVEPRAEEWRLHSGHPLFGPLEWNGALSRKRPQPQRAGQLLNRGRRRGRRSRGRPAGAPRPPAPQILSLSCFPCTYARPFIDVLSGPRLSADVCCEVFAPTPRNAVCTRLMWLFSLSASRRGIPVWQRVVCFERRAFFAFCLNARLCLSVLLPVVSDKPGETKGRRYIRLPRQTVLALWALK